MRAPSFYSDPRFIDSRGANLPAAIERLRRSETSPGQVYAELANRLSALIDDIHELRIKDDERMETLTLEIRGRDGVFHPASSLSDGTLRFLVLATLGLDPEARGVLCLEEPENGIHPQAVEAVFRALAGTYDAQILCASHSPVFLAQAEPEAVLCFARTSEGATDIVRGSEHPNLLSWKKSRGTDLGTLFATGVLG